MSGRAEVRAVLFDLGGTLVDYHDFAHWVDLARHCFVDVGEESLARAFFDVERETDTPERVEYAEFWRQVLSRAADRDVPVSAAARFLELTRERPGFWRLYSDTRRCLEDLEHDGYRLAVISNSTSEAHCRSILHETGILPFFERVTSSGTEGVEKPDPEIFRRTVSRMKLAPEETFYVGNLAFTDAQGARNAGMHAIWLNRAGTGMSAEPPEITSLLELPLCVTRARGRTAAAPAGRRRAA
jgi:putative hydrolase of the HAD superfamily